MQIARPNTLPIGDLRNLLREVIGKRKKTPLLCWKCGEYPARDVHHLNGDHGDQSPSNLEPWCRLCHDRVHNIPLNIVDLRLATRTLAGIQQERIAVENRLRTYHEVDQHPPETEFLLDTLRLLEETTLATVTHLVEQVPIYTEWLSKVKGIGPAIGAVLVGEYASSDRFQTISAMWSYSGLGLDDQGQARKRAKGEVANWMPRLRMILCGRLADSFIRLADKKATGRRLYDQYKAFYVERDTPKGLTKDHINRRARRKLVKVFLGSFWLAWRRLDGLPITQPYVVEKMCHTHVVTPEDWAGEDWMD